MEAEGIIKRKKGWLILPKPKRFWGPGMASKDFS